MILSARFSSDLLKQLMYLSKSSSRFLCKLICQAKWIWCLAKHCIQYFLITSQSKWFYLTEWDFQLLGTFYWEHAVLSKRSATQMSSYNLWSAVLAWIIYATWSKQNSSEHAIPQSTCQIHHNWTWFSSFLRRHCICRLRRNQWTITWGSASMLEHRWTFMHWGSRILAGSEVKWGISCGILLWEPKTFWVTPQEAYPRIYTWVFYLCIILYVSRQRTCTVYLRQINVALKMDLSIYVLIALYFQTCATGITS